MEPNNTNGFVLQPEIYWYNSKLVRIYAPLVEVEGLELCWIYCLDDRNVTVANCKDLKLADKEVQLLYGS